MSPPEYDNFVGNDVIDHDLAPCAYSGSGKNAVGLAHLKSMTINKPRLGVERAGQRGRAQREGHLVSQEFPQYQTGAAPLE
jgi:hypothetical protein